MESSLYSIQREGAEHWHGHHRAWQSNKLTINVPMLDAAGAPIAGQSFSFDTTVSGDANQKDDKYEIAFNVDSKKDNRNANELLKTLQTKATVKPMVAMPAQALQALTVIWSRRWAAK